MYPLFLRCIDNVFNFMFISSLIFYYCQKSSVQFSVPVAS
nr:MAG TPA: hypothetical protein [Caudoviricetes sp.]